MRSDIDIKSLWNAQSVPTADLLSIRKNMKCFRLQRIGEAIVVVVLIMSVIVFRILSLCLWIHIHFFFCHGDHFIYCFIDLDCFKLVYLSTLYDQETQSPVCWFCEMYREEEKRIIVLLVFFQLNSLLQWSQCKDLVCFFIRLKWLYRWWLIIINQPLVCSIKLRTLFLSIQLFVYICRYGYIM